MSPSKCIYLLEFAVFVRKSLGISNVMLFAWYEQACIAFVKDHL